MAPYMLFPFIAGDLGVGDVNGSVSMDAGQVLGALDFGIMLYVEATHPQWAIGADAIVVDFGRQGTLPLSGRTGEVDLEMVFTQLFGLRRLAPWAEAGVGGRLVFQRVAVSAPAVQVVPALDRSGSALWFDPLLVVRLTVPWESQWRFGMLADFGGFTVGSDYAWQLYPYAGYRFHPRFEVDAAFRALGMKYQRGEGSERYVYDLVIFGPEVGVSFHF